VDEHLLGAFGIVQTNLVETGAALAGVAFEELLLRVEVVALAGSP